MQRDFCSFLSWDERKEIGKTKKIKKEFEHKKNNKEKNKEMNKEMRFVEWVWEIFG